VNDDALTVRDLGRTAYSAARELQSELVDARARGEIGDQLLVTEHEEVITLGRGTPKDEPLPAGVPVERIERGGQATWHGPGQTVLYPILLLPEGRRDLHRYLRDLEQVVIDALATLGLEGTRREGLTGVWLGGRKVCSIGVAVRKWVTWHGLALNVSNDPGGFARFRPCGLTGDQMTRVADHVGVPGDDPRLERALVRAFRTVFER
jgi:lipoyl(octanoyl) transferase